MFLVYICIAMFPFLLSLHSLFRWLVLISLVYSIFRALRGYVSNAGFSKVDNSWRHWTATISHIQLLIGMILYLKSPIIHYFYTDHESASQSGEIDFFAMIHILLMFISVVLVTIGSALTKRRLGDMQKFKTMLTWFSASLLIIFIAIPWPFSPLATRPYFRYF